MYSNKLTVKIYLYNNYYVVMIALNRIRSKAVNRSKSTEMKVVLIPVWSHLGFKTLAIVSSGMRIFPPEWSHLLKAG